MEIALDIRTIFSLLTACCVLGFILLVIDMRRQSSWFDRCFIAGLGLQAVAWTLIGLRGIVPDIVSFSIGNSIQFIGMAMLGLGLMALKITVSVRWIRVYAIALALILVFWWLPGLQNSTHIFLISLVYPFFLGVPGWHMLRDRRRGSALQRFVGGSLLCYSAIMLLRGVSIFVGGPYDLFSRSFFQIFVIFVFSLVMILVTLGYILVKKEEANELLKEKSEQNTMLLTELQHRIKNSLAIIASLTELEMGTREGDEAIKASMLKIRDRIGAVAELYNLLLVDTRAQGVFIDAYIKEIVARLFEGYASLTGNVGIELAVEHLEIDAKTSVSIGLIVNELVTNALKYAFPDGRPGRIRVGFRLGAEGKRELVVEDDGIGMPDEPGGLGTLIVSSLATQINGAISRAGGEGTEVRISF